MDYRTKLTVTGTLLGVLTLTALLGWTFSRQVVVARDAEKPLIENFLESSVTGLELDNGVVLAKTDVWHLTYQGKSYPVSTDRIDTYLKTLSKLERERLVTTGSDVAAFGLDKGYHRLKVLGPSGAVIVDLQIGGTNELGDKVYVRSSGSKEVWQTDRGFARTLDLDFNTWADLSLFPGKQAKDLVRLQFDSRIETTDRTVYTPFDMVRSSEGTSAKWQNRLGGTLPDAFSTWIGLVPSTRFSAFVGPQETAPAGGDLGKLTAYWSDGTLTSVTFHGPDSQNRYRATSGNRDFWINDWALGQVLFH